MTTSADKPLLECRRIGKRFGGVTALEDVDFTLRAGEVHGVVGSNGAGKSTLMKILAGVLPDHQGTVLLDDRPAEPRIRTGSLSGGNQQKIVIARWLLGPVRGLLLAHADRILVISRGRITHEFVETQVDKSRLMRYA